ncbi:MAG: ComF family protein [Oscillospiraceae bacterium]|nr:ComF family protein [Oscillospiraceae bacterium]
MAWTRSLLNFFYPNRCPGCGCFLPAQALLCADCEAGILLHDYCSCCGKPVCQCGRGTLAYDRAVVCSAYAGAAARAILCLKDAGNTNFAPFAAAVLARRLREGAYPAPELVVPVPMHPDKQRRRGYNQAALIGKALAAHLGIPMREDVLYKADTGREQHRLSARERQLGDGGFSAGSVRLDGQCVLLCDDVLTTGSTMHRCAALLKECGASAVIAAAACTTPRK